VTHSDLDLTELLDAIRAGGDIDVVRKGVELVLQALIEAEATEVIGAALHERTETRTKCLPQPAFRGSKLTRGGRSASDHGLARAGKAGLDRATNLSSVSHAARRSHRRHRVRSAVVGDARDLAALPLGRREAVIAVRSR
jgi:hypothetical protein